MEANAHFVLFKNRSRFGVLKVTGEPFNFLYHCNVVLFSLAFQMQVIAELQCWKPRPTWENP